MILPTMLTQKDLAEIDAFHRLCFPTDYFGLKVWEDLLSDPRTLVYAIREGMDFWPHFWPSITGRVRTTM
jgi:hypothetical protein